MNEQHQALALGAHIHSGIDAIRGVVEYHRDDRRVSKKVENGD